MGLIKQQKQVWNEFEEWIEREKKGVVSERTLEKYELTLRHCQTLMPGIRFSQFDRNKYQKLLDLYAETHERATVVDFYRQTNAFFKDMHYEGALEKEVGYKIVIRGKEPKEKKVKYLEVDEVRRLELMWHDRHDVFADVFLLLLKTGMRWAEALGVTPKDIDMKRSAISINKTMLYKNKDWDKKWGRTKNSSSVRKITVDIKTMVMLSKMMEGCPEDYSIIAHYYGKRPFNSTFAKRLAEDCKTAGVNVVSLHALRHTHASLLISNGISIQTVATRLGHSNTVTTQKTYIHMLKDLQLQDNFKIMWILGNM